MTILRVTFGIFAIIGGVCALFGIVRGVWGGGFGGAAPKDHRDRVQVGAVSSAGFGLLFISLGLVSLCGDAMPKSFGVGLVAIVFAAFFLIIGGWLLDSRAHDAERGAYRLPGEIKAGTPAERQRLIIAVCG